MQKRNPINQETQNVEPTRAQESKTLERSKGEKNKEQRDNTRANFSGDIAYSIDEACDILNIGKTMLYAELGYGRLKARRCGARRLILASELNRYLLSLPEA